MLERIDAWNSDWNFLSATKAQRLTALIEVGIALFLWIVRGWDSGIGQYGTSLHYSVFVIYGLEYALLNLWIDKVHNIKGIRNLIVSCMATVGSLALFEWYWGIGYAFIHGEKWVLTPMNTVYTELVIITLMGALGIIYALRLGIKIKINRLTLLLLLPAALWIISGFPQTCYPKLDGTVIYIENNLVHLYNVMAKSFMAMATATIIMN